MSPSETEPRTTPETPRTEDRALSEVLHAQTARALHQHLGLETVGDLLEHFPRRYMPRGELTSFSELVPGQEVSLMSRVLGVSVRSLHTRRGSIAEVTVTDRLDPADPAGGLSGDHDGAQTSPDPDDGPAPGLLPLPAQPGGARLDGLAGAASGPGGPFGAPHPAPGEPGQVMELSFFNAWTAAKDLVPGSHVLFSGKVSEYRGRLTLTNPHYAVLTDTSGAAAEGEDVNAPIPVYPATAKYTTDRVAEAVRKLLAAVDLSTLEDPVPEVLRRRHRLMTAEQAYRAVHRPQDEDDPRQALRYFRYREALVLQSVLARRAALWEARRTRSFPEAPGGLVEAFDVALPFRRTAGQVQVGQEIAADLGRTVPMNRLLQGDVGSGKTLVALRAMLQVADAGGQAAMLAPTEVLAGQHLRSITAALGELAAPAGPVRVVLLTASMPAAARRAALLDIASGAAQVVVGTHALLGEKVSFADLGLVVVDEQHRFGVQQRHALAGSDGEPVHRLVMTATPIPRSVAMTVFGDLAVSTLDELPAGRQEVATHVVSLAQHPSWEDRLWQRAREEIDAGHQVFVVVPSISEDTASGARAGGDAPGLQSVEGLGARLRGLPALSGARIADLHGRMPGEAKTRAMQEMAAGRIDLLVATTVIEVGVDVPNATLMIIMDADRLGISTLHQLRGRIGRGGLPGTCLLVTEQDEDGASMERLRAVAATRDGFELSLVDLEQRREGDILGSSQSGNRSTLKNVSVLRHPKTIEQTRRDARELWEQDPGLHHAPALAAAVERADAQEQTEYLYQG